MAADRVRGKRGLRSLEGNHAKDRALKGAYGPLDYTVFGSSAGAAAAQDLPSYIAPQNAIKDVVSA